MIDPLDPDATSPGGGAGGGLTDVCPFSDMSTVRRVAPSPPPDACSAWEPSDTLPTGAPAVLAPDPRPELVTVPDIEPHWTHVDGAPITDADIRDLLYIGHHRCFAVAPSRGRLAIAWAMVCLETGRGKAMHGANFGNMAELNGAPCVPVTAREVIDGRDVQRTQCLTAYPTLEEGAAGYWHRLAVSYSAALATFDAGDGALVAHALKLARYYTGDEGQYAAAMVSLVREYGRRWP